MLKLNVIAAAGLLTALSCLSATLAAEASTSSATAPIRPLDAELAEIASLLPGRYFTQSAGTAGAALFHKIVPITAPQFGARAFYHQISRDGFDSSKPLQQKIYVLDETRNRRRNTMRAWVVRPGQGFANLEQDAKALAELMPAMLMSFPKGCEIRWARGAGAREFSATVRRGDCQYDSAAFRQRVSPEMRYELSPAAFSMRDVIWGADQKLLFPDSGLMRAPRLRTAAEVLADTSPADWRAVNPANTLYLDLDAGRVIIELAPQFAPNSVANILALVRAGYFDGLSINRVQDNFVVQWGDPDATKPLGAAAKRIAPEFARTWSADLPFTALPDADGYSPERGFSNGLPVAGDRAAGLIWPAHCYATLGVGRDNGADTGNGSELYVVIGHAPRQLERNITVAGRVLRGMEHLAALPRGSDAMGFYAQPAQRIAIRAMRVAADLPAAGQIPLEVLRTDSASFEALIEARRNRRDDWYLHPAGHIDLCSVPIPVRTAAARRAER
jgi:peptidylprolyl isomerase